MSTRPLSTIILPAERWPEIEYIEREVFNDIMPSSPRQTAFLTAVDGSELAGHLRAEHLYDLTSLYHFVHVYADPARRNHAGLAIRLMTEAAQCIPRGFSAVWLTRKPYPHLATMLSAREMGRFWLYRKDN